MAHALFSSSKFTGRLNDVLRPGAGPIHITGLFFTECNDPLAAHIDCIVIEAQLSGKDPMHRVILELIDHVVRGDRVVDGDNFNVVTECSLTDCQTSDSTEAVDTHFYTHCQISPLLQYSLMQFSCACQSAVRTRLLYTIIWET